MKSNNRQQDVLSTNVNLQL